MLDPLTKLKGDVSASDVQDNLHRWVESLRQHPLLRGNLLENIDLTTTSILVDHKLGRPHVGWIVVRKDNGVDIWETEASTDKSISLDASGTVTISLWVF